MICWSGTVSNRLFPLANAGVLPLTLLGPYLAESAGIEPALLILIRYIKMPPLPSGVTSRNSGPSVPSCHRLCFIRSPMRRWEAVNPDEGGKAPPGGIAVQEDGPLSLELVLAWLPALYPSPAILLCGPIRRAPPLPHSRGALLLSYASTENSNSCRAFIASSAEAGC